jgi:hypothetical protein
MARKDMPERRVAAVRIQTVIRMVVTRTWWR